MKASILIPVYNEQATLREILRRVRAVDLTLDGSNVPNVNGPITLRGMRNGIGVAVQRQQARLWTQARQDEAGVAAAPEGGVHIAPLRARTDGRIPQGFHSLVQQNSLVLPRGHGGLHRGQKVKSCRAWGMGSAITAASWAA